MIADIITCISLIVLLRILPARSYILDPSAIRYLLVWSLIPSWDIAFVSSVVDKIIVALGAQHRLDRLQQDTCPL